MLELTLRAGALALAPRCESAAAVLASASAKLDQQHVVQRLLDETVIIVKAARSDPHESCLLSIYNRLKEIQGALMAALQDVTTVMHARRIAHEATAKRVVGWQPAKRQRPNPIPAAASRP